MGSNPVEALIFFRLLLSNCLNWKIYCDDHNSLSKKLQHVQTFAARIVTHTRKCDHITPVLCRLHWLPIEERSVFKILLLTFKCLDGLAPPYLRDLITKYVPRRNLRSINGHRLLDDGYKLTRHGLRSFSVASAKLWNALLLDIRTSDNSTQFKRNLKTDLFRKVFY